MQLIQAAIAQRFDRSESIPLFIEWFIACAMLVIGASLLTRPRVWIAAVTATAAHPFAPLLWGLYALLAGLAVVMNHDLWVADARVLVTLIGWAALLSGVLFLLVPEAYGWVLRRLPITPKLVALRGLVRIALGGAVIGYLISQG